MNDNRMKSFTLVSLMVLTSLSALLLALPTAVASNETQSGVISGTEIWQGSHTVTGNVEVAPGAKLIIQPGTTVTMANGTFLHVRGNLCAADTGCGANGMGSNSSKATFTWSDPSNWSARGNCYWLNNPSNGQPLYNADPSCYEGILIRDTIDVQQTKLNHLEIKNAYGIPRFATDISEVRYGALVFDGASPTSTGLLFEDINTSSVLILDLASPHFVGGTFTVGSEERVESLLGQAIQAYGAGTPNNPVTLDSPVFSGTSSGCSSQDNGRHVVWAQKSFLNIDHGVVASADYGYRYTDSAGTISSNTLQTDCTGIDVNGRRTILGYDYELFANHNSISTADNSPLTAYDGALVTFEDNVMEGADDGSGIQVVSNYPELAEVKFSRNIIGPIGGYNGIWGVGYVDIIADNNTFQDINREPVIIGEYHFGDQGWTVSGPQPARGWFADNTFSNVSGTCQSEKVWDSEFTCPVFHLFRSSVSIHRNTVNNAQGDAIRAIGAIIDVQDNSFTAAGVGARVVQHDVPSGPQYGSLAFFSGNTWNNVSQVYNISESSVTVQSELIPNPTSSTTYPMELRWISADADPNNGWGNKLDLAPTQIIPPRNFPLSLELVNNSTVLTFANLTNFDLSKAHIAQAAGTWSVQLRRAELVRFRATVNGVRVGGATVLLEDAHGNDMYDMDTDPFGFTPWVALPSDFHLDIRGNGDNPNDFAGDPGENSCSDGIDNDGDLLYDSDDPDCQQGSATRELSKYYVTTYKFGKGYEKHWFNLTGTLDQVISLDNMAPTVTVTQLDGHSFKRQVNFTGSGWDGNIGTGIFNSDEQARWEQKGAIERIEIKTPASSSWNDTRYAVDDSNANGEVTSDNRPFRIWHFEYDMSLEPENDYTFEFRAWDGVDYSPVVTRTIRLNTVAPVIHVVTPTDGSLFDSGIVTFSGTASDPYNGVYGSDIDQIHFEISSSVFNTTTVPVVGGPIWSWDWNFSGMPKVRTDWMFRIWASDSSFCRGVIGECTPVELTLDIDNTNAPPLITLIEPYDMQVVRAGPDTIISGVARDTDGDVSKVEIRILDPQDAMNERPPGPHSVITTIAPNGAWSTTWDTSRLVHDFHYLVQARSKDGQLYSDWVQREIIIDNPPDANNLAPIYLAEGETVDLLDGSSVTQEQSWQRTHVIFCEENSQAPDRCGDGASVELAGWFYDPEGEDLSIEVWDDPQTYDDDQCAEQIQIDVNGKATYNPVAMSFYSPDMAEWSCSGMKFLAKDPHNSKAYSLEVDFVVNAVSFSVQRVGSGNIDVDGTVTFAGTGRPGVEVVARSGLNAMRLGSAQISENGSWTIDVPASKLERGSNIVVFDYDNERMTETSYSIQVGDADDGSKFGWILWALLLVVIVALLGGVFVFFFVEFEEVDDESLLMSEESQEDEDVYAWGKQAPQEQAAAQPAAHAAAQPAAEPAAQPAYPGWQWDAASNQWIPDQSGGPPQQ